MARARARDGVFSRSLLTDLDKGGMLRPHTVGRPERTDPTTVNENLLARARARKVHGYLIPLLPSDPAVVELAQDRAKE